MLTRALEPLTAAAFAPYGDVLAAPTAPGERALYADGLTPDRADTRISLHVNHVPPSALLFVATRMEHHPATSQTFLPLEASRFLVVVAGRAPDGGPDPVSLRGFWSPGSQGVTHHAGVWHHGMVALDRPAHFAVLMWRRDEGIDDVFVDLPAPVALRLRGRPSLDEPARGGA